jgi:hypothetical protein
MPWRDWQFWLVTTLMAISLWRLARMFIPAARPRNTNSKRAALTIEGRSV